MDTTTTQTNDRTMPTNSITLEEIRAARDTCAMIIAQYGERFLPIFERLENEIEKQEEKQELLKKALRINSKFATQSATRFATQIATQFNHHASIVI